MILFHGTYLDFDRIDLSKSNKGKDFGKGFYLSENKEQAEKMAVFKSLQYGSKPIILKYDFDKNFLKRELSFLKFTKYSKEWADFILRNRMNENDANIRQYDVVYGPIANDKIGVQIRNLIEQNIDMDVFLERLKYVQGITFQYFFGTERAISKLVRI
ncbi:MAG: DUF3990 domain-containing protein [Bacteroidales bacterium]|nr:DUF3990 domain-containing protein [Bacteroidales bacterium]